MSSNISYSPGRIKCNLVVYKSEITQNVMQLTWNYIVDTVCMIPGKERKIVNFKLSREIRRR